MMKKLAATGLAAATAFALAACGSDDTSEKAPGGTVKVSSVAQACDLLGTSITEFSSQLQTWLYSGAKHTERSSDFDQMAAMVEDSDPGQAEVKGYATQINALTPKLKAAIAKNDDTEVRRIVDEAKKPHDEFIARCSEESEWDSTAIKKLRALLDEEPAKLNQSSSAPAAPSASVEPGTKAPAPFKPTPLGTAVKVGQSVSVEYKDSDGKPGKSYVTVTKVKEASDKDVEKLSAKVKESAKKFVFVEISAKRASMSPSEDEAYIALPNPQFKVMLSNGTSADRVIFFGKFEPCMDKNEGLEERQCIVYGIPDASLKVTDVQLQEIASKGRDGGEPLYIWKN